MSVLSALSVSRRPAAAFVVVGLFWGCFAAYVPVLKHQLGASDALFGMLLLGSATGLVSSMWLAPRADRLWGARSMQISIVLLAAAWLLPSQITVPIMEGEQEWGRLELRFGDANALDRNQTKVAKLILETCPELRLTPGPDGMLPIHLAVLKEQYSV